MNILRTVQLAITCSVFAFSCNEATQVFDEQKETAEILRLLKKEQEYHLNKDSVGFANSLGNGLTSVNRGFVNTATIEENTSRFNRYFSSVEFVKWDDLKEPVIRFSEDGKMAYAIIEKEVILMYEDEGKSMEETTEFAWVSIYRKTASSWQIEVVASTNKQSTEREL